MAQVAEGNGGQCLDDRLLRHLTLLLQRVLPGLNRGLNVRFCQVFIADLSRPFGPIPRPDGRLRATRARERLV
jgi:hypothetical protein